MLIAIKKKLTDKLQNQTQVKVATFLFGTLTFFQKFDFVI